MIATGTATKDNLLQKLKERSINSIQLARTVSSSIAGTTMQTPTATSRATIATVANNDNKISRDTQQKAIRDKMAAIAIATAKSVSSSIIVRTTNITATTANNCNNSSNTSSSNKNNICSRASHNNSRTTGRQYFNVNGSDYYKDINM